MQVIKVHSKTNSKISVAKRLRLGFRIIGKLCDFKYLKKNVVASPRLIGDSGLIQKITSKHSKSLSNSQSQKNSQLIRKIELAVVWRNGCEISVAKRLRQTKAAAS